MIRAAPLALFALWAVPADPALAAADGWGKKPYELVRELQIFQNGAVLKTKSDRAEQKERIANIAARLSEFDPRVWADPKNARAAVIYVLSGGDPRVLRKLLGAGVALGVDEKLVKAAVAYGERRDSKAIELFDGIDMSALDQSLAGHVALVRALLIAEKDPSKALALLDVARLAASGTIVEEAALRRQAIISAKTNKLDAFESLSSQYLRRFASSIFAQSFQRQFAENVMARGYAPGSERLSRLEAMLRALPESERREACLMIAEEGIAAANVEMVRFAARVAAVGANAKPADARRLRLFEAAALVVTADSEKGVLALYSIDRSRLDAREEALLDAALAVSREVRRPPLPASGAEPAAEAQADKPVDAAGSSLIKDANEAIAHADQLLTEAAR
jgi:chemotaxis protein MotC